MTQRHQFEVDRDFRQITRRFEQDEWERGEQAQRDAFVADPRPIPEGLVPTRGAIPTGHIALMGDFDRPSTPRP